MTNTTESALHTAVCQAVSLLNVAPEVARCKEGREARDILRQALANYADAFMDEPAPEAERVAVARKHQRASQSDSPIGYLTRFKSQVEDAEKCFPGEDHDHLWSYTHGTKKMEHFAAFPDLEVVPVYATPKSAKGLTVQADADGVWLAFAASTGRHALLHVERIADSHGGIVSKALRDWATDVTKAPPAA